MAYKIFDDLTTDSGAHEQAPMTMQIDGQMTLELPDASFVRDADLQRDGMDLVLKGPDGTMIIEGYFAADPAPDLMAPGGETLTPELVQSFAKSPAQYAQTLAMNDASPVGEVEEYSGDATVTHMDGSVETITAGTKIFQGDIIETNDAGAVNIRFIDDTTFAVSEDARLAIDEYVFDPSSQAGTSNFSVLKGVFVFTSGLIGRDDPDDVNIDTPVGSIGIRGTIIMGNVDTGEITVVEGAIVLRDFQGHEMTLASQFESAKFVPNANIESLGTLSANDVGNKFASIGKVSPTLFSSLHDAATEDPSVMPPLVAEAPVVEEETVEEIVVAAVNPQPEQPLPVQQPTTQLQQPLAPQPVLSLAGADPFTGQTNTLSSPSLKLASAATAPLQPPPPAGTVSGSSSSGNTSGNTGANSGTQTGSQTGSSTDGTLPPPLAIDVQTFAIPENYSGGPVLVARLTGQFSPTVTYSLVDPTSSYQMMNYNGTSVEIWTQSGVGNFLDREAGDMMPTLGFTATNGTGSATVTGPLHIAVSNVNEEPYVRPLAETGIPAEYFQASEGQYWSLDLRSIFADYDIVDSLTYSVVSGVGDITTGFSDGYFLGTSINLGTGQINGDFLWFDFANTNFGLLNGAGANFNFQIVATDDEGEVSGTPFNVSFNVRDAIGAGASSIGATITGGPGNTHNDSFNVVNDTDVTSDGNFILFNGGDDQVTLSGGASGNQINGGTGNDVFDFAGTANVNNYLLGGDGNDRFIMGSATGDEVNNWFYGMNGDDTFELSMAALTYLRTNNLPNALIDGGHGYDTLRLTGGGALNFEQIFDLQTNEVRNIERIDTRNGTGNTIQIDFSDVMQLTDHNNVLRIERDAADALTIELEGATYTVQDTGNGFLAYNLTDGTNNVTLLVENNGGAISVV